MYKYNKNNDLLIGQFFYNKKLSFVLTENKDLIYIENKHINRTDNNQFVLIKIINEKITSKKSKKFGLIKKVLGNENDINTCINIAIKKYNLITNFSKKTNLDIKYLNDDISSDMISKRTDLRHLPFITIDGKDAKDFDDAIYCEKININSNSEYKFKLIIAIADVSHYVSEFSNIDQDAFKRGTSIYFPNKVIPMLPKKLSNDICSLLPNKDRLTLVCEIILDMFGVIDSYKFYESIIRSNFRFNYEDAYQLVTNISDNKFISNKIHQNIFNIYNIYKILKQKKYNNKNMNFDLNEIKFNIKKNRINKIEILERNDMHKAIEECMLTANICAADFLINNNSDALFRIHEKPNVDKIDNLFKFLISIGISIEKYKKMNLHELYFDLLENTKNHAQYKLIQSMCLRSLQQAKYSFVNIGHFGLSYKAYVHFTSPIRRYPDLLIHRFIKSILKNNQCKNIENKSIDDLMSSKERLAEESSRFVSSWYKCLFAKSYIGQLFSGVITSIVQFGLFISLDDINIEGMIHISSLGNEKFKFDKNNHILLGKYSKKTFCISDKILVKIEKVDLFFRKVYLIPVNR
ncbi:Ribonuclease R [Candidatus Kinetoplastibacterium sorsogonicusi]|uniref:exoribonuclease II n=1 Tax=Candidatus Kinetoplastidibacterium kentomonadis TaxID=1576550 RepID=A0A3Q8F3K2_9PROT|nr:ribonuclease R [Candidatus Kinetoplastibacterium sorsogonicusi]AWD32461.1 Ribonuclease R [Candidatus Kinetoplastibacterium sorsogonicusi]